MQLPILPMTRPSSLNGELNGRITPSKLKQTVVAGLQMVEPAQRCFDAMAFAMMGALGADLELRQVGGYRSLHGQWYIFCGPAKRYEPCTYAEYMEAKKYGRGKVWRDARRRSVAQYLGVAIAESEYWRKIRRPNGTYPATAAVPEESNHGWGLAADIAEEYDDDTAADPIRSATVRWLVEHAHEFGFSAEAQSEPWHWRFVAGDRIPAQVLVIEAYIDSILNPDKPRPPTIDPEEDDMQTMTTPQRVYDSREHGPLAAGVTREVALIANVVGVNLTVTSPADDGYLVAWGAGDRPGTSNVNFAAGQTVANFARVVLDDGVLRLWSSSACHVIVDLQAAG